MTDETRIGWLDPVVLKLTGEECCALWDALNRVSYINGELHQVNTRTIRDRLWSLRREIPNG